MKLTAALVIFLALASTPLQKKIIIPIPPTGTYHNWVYQLSTTQLLKPGNPHKQQIDTVQLKRSSWYQGMISHIEQEEYNIQVLGSKGYRSPNRRQGLRSFYSPGKFTLEPRTNDDWKLEFLIKGIYVGNKKIYTTQKDALASITKNKLAFNHNNEFTIEYINSKEGVRQNFIIQREPASTVKQLAVKLKVNEGWFINRVQPGEIHFAKKGNKKIDKKLQYNDLKVWDAKQEELHSFFEVQGNEISIIVDTYGAKFPVTIDPISSTSNWLIESNQSNAQSGWNVASAGDVNGDGYSDVLVTAPYYDNGQSDEGKVFAYYGSATGLSGTANWSYESNQSGALLGYNANSAGDVNADGYSDVIVGAQFNDNGQTDEGMAFVFHGSAIGLPPVANWTAEGNQANSYFGFSVASAGDVNNDGYSDVIIGAPYYDNGNTDEGKAFVYYGSNTGLLPAPAWTAEANADNMYFGGTLNGFVGTGVACAGDVNGDGYSDIIVAAVGYDNTQIDEGRVYLFLGSLAGPSLTADWTAESNYDSGRFGNSLASAGDVNGDGYSDIIVGAFGVANPQINEGRVFLYYGNSSGLNSSPAWTHEINVAGALYGCSVATAGDVNGDGYSDVIIGASVYNNGQSAEGAAFAFFGSASGLPITPDWSFESNMASAYFGITLASAGDVNGDGYSDIIVGAGGYSNGESFEGGAYVFHGFPDGISLVAVNTPDDADQANAEFGVSVACAGDVNADGYSDVVIGAWRYDDGGNPDEGIAFVYHGSASGLSASYNYILNDCNQSGAFFGETVASAGDVNGDGYSDVIIGADNYDDGPNSNEGRAFVYHGSASGLSTTANSILDDADQAFAFFGVSVASAGDVNGDGYGEVIVGAIGITDGGNANEGRAYVYYGSSTGLGNSPGDTPDDADQANAWFGWSVAGAGDVNGDGYSDVIIGANTYDEPGNADEGKVFVYHGSAIGLNAIPNNTPDDADQPGAWFGVCVAGAGDINGDGYGDVIIGAYTYDDGANTDEGKAFVYHGSASGLGNSPNNTPDDADQASARFGISVASAGDVNGDGYSDVIIGAYWYDDGANTNEGRGFIYHGSAAGLGATPNSTPNDANENSAQYAYSVASAGDVNGDGYGDIIIGSHQSDDGVTSNEGKAFLYYGNKTAGLRNNLRLYNSDLVTPIQQSNMNDPNLFGAGLFSKSFLGRTKGKLVWETVRNGNPFSGNPITNSTAYTAQQTAYNDLGISGIELKNQVAKQVPTKATYIRARLKYDPVTAINGQLYGPWRYPESFLRGKRDIGAVALPVKFLSFNVLKEKNNCILRWITTNEDPGVNFEVQHSWDGINFNKLTVLPGLNLPRNEYQWLHTAPGNGRHFYRIRAFRNDAFAFTPIRVMIFDETPVSLFPNPASPGQYITISSDRLESNKNVTIKLISPAGQVSFQYEIQSMNRQVSVRLPSIPPDIYTLILSQGNWRQAVKILINRN